MKRPTSKPHYLLAIDTGLREAGAALFRDGKLDRVALIHSGNSSDRDARAWCAMADEVYRRFPEAHELVIEMMVVRQGRRDVNPDDLMQLVGVAGVIIGTYRTAEATVLRPEDWKGRLKKRIHHQRVISSMDPNSARILERYMADRDRPRYTTLDSYVDACYTCRGNNFPDDPIHNVVDAIGLGLSWIG